MPAQERQDGRFDVLSKGGAVDLAPSPMKTIRLSTIMVFLAGIVLAFPYVLQWLNIAAAECRVCPGETLESAALMLLLIGFPLCSLVGVISAVVHLSHDRSRIRFAELGALVGLIGIWWVAFISRFDAL
jgi:hypothetical protein